MSTLGLDGHLQYVKLWLSTCYDSLDGYSEKTSPVCLSKTIIFHVLWIGYLYSIFIGRLPRMPTRNIGAIIENVFFIKKRYEIVTGYLNTFLDSKALFIWPRRQEKFDANKISS